MIFSNLLLILRHIDSEVEYGLSSTVQVDVESLAGNEGGQGELHELWGDESTNRDGQREGDRLEESRKK